MDKITVIGVLASVCTATSLPPQLVKISKEKKAEGVSLVMLLVLFAGLGPWIYYGMLKKDFIIIASNSLSLLINVAIMVQMIRFGKKSN